MFSADNFKIRDARVNLKPALSLSFISQGRELDPKLGR